MKKIVLLGAPGCGKGTQSKFLVSKLNFFQLSFHSNLICTTPFVKHEETFKCLEIKKLQIALVLITLSQVNKIM